MLKQAKLNKISTALRHNKIAKGAAALAAVASLFGAPAYAEEAATTAESDVEVIEVKGIRGTVTRSINEKKNTAAIVDAIAAADFGELPGLSISDIIENIPGASGIRLKGSQNEISIRGLGSNFGYATFNGRTITNGTGSRATNFKKFPSDLVDKVVVYKTQQADLVEGGTSGTIEIASLRAVDYGKNQTVVELQGIYNDQYSNVESPGVTPWGNKVVLSTIQSWETDNFGDFGFTFGYVESNDSNPEEFFNASSRAGVCALRDSDGNALEANAGDECADAGNATAISEGQIGRGVQIQEGDLDNFDPDSIFFVPETAAFRTVADIDTRQNTVVTFQWVPNDQWDINLDYEYSKLQTEEQRYEVGIDNRQTDLRNHIISNDRTLAFVEGRSRIDFQGELREQLDTYEGGGLEITYNPNDALTLTADLSYSDSFRDRQRQRNNLRSDERFYYSFDARDSTVPEVRFFGDSDLTEAIDLTDIGQFLGTDAGSAPRIEFSRDNDQREDDIWAVRFDADYALEHDIFSSVGVGVRYSREHLLDFQDNQVALNLDGSELQRSQQIDANDVGADFTEADLLQLGQDIANNCQVEYSNSELFQDGGGVGGDFASFNSECFIGEILDVTDTEARRELTGDVGDEGFFDIGQREDGRSGDDVDVREDILALYAIAHIDTELNDKPLSGNVGFRVVRTQVASQGFADSLTATTNGTFIDPVTGVEAPVFSYAVDSNEVVSLRSDTSFFLPSINLTYAASDTVQVKAAASKSISRFRLDAFSSGFSIEECGGSSEGSACDPNTETDVNEGIQSITANGNHLDPFVSNNYDLSLEWYPSADSAVTLGLYWKNFTGGSTVVTEQRDIDITVDGAAFTVEDVDVSVTQTDPRSSTIKGFEFVVNQNFSSLPAPFNGLGVNVAWNHAISDFVTPEVASPGIVDDANLFGFSEDVVSSSLYWEGDKTSLRLLYKYRSSFFQPNNLPFPDRSARFTQATEYWDFSSKYKLTKNVSLSFKVLNLFDEPQVQTRSNDSTASDVSRSGRKFFLSAKVKF